MQSFGQMYVGLLGMRRRIADYDPTLRLEIPNELVTISAFVIGLSVLIFIINLAYSAKRGPLAPANPWRSRSPEWLLPSPPPIHNYSEPLEVLGEPYDYGLEGSVYVRFAEPHSAQPAHAD